MPINSAFPAIKPLPGTKKNFPEVKGRVNSQPMTFRKSNKNSSGDEAGLNQILPSTGKIQLPKQRTHHDSSAVSACLKTNVGKSKESEFKSKIPVRKPEIAGNRKENTTKPKWDSTTQVTRSAGIKPLPGTKKTLEDFVRKPFRATPAPNSTRNPKWVVMPKDRSAVKTNSIQQSVEKSGNKNISENVNHKPFKAAPVLASTYKPFRPLKNTENSKTRQSVDKSNTKEGMEQLIAEPFVQNEATTLEQVAILNEPNADLFDPVESTDAQAEAVDIQTYSV
jgi:hypothetical protein